MSGIYKREMREWGLLPPPLVRKQGVPAASGSTNLGTESLSCPWFFIRNTSTLSFVLAQTLAHGWNHWYSVCVFHPQSNWNFSLNSIKDTPGGCLLVYDQFNWGASVILGFKDTEDEEVCCVMMSPRNGSEIVPMMLQQYGSLNKNWKWLYQ